MKKDNEDHLIHTILVYILMVIIATGIFWAVRDFIPKEDSGVPAEKIHLAGNINYMGRSAYGI